MNEDPTAWKSWIGRALTVEDEIGPRAHCLKLINRVCITPPRQDPCVVIA